MDLFFRIFQHLLPSARAWRIVIEKQLREFFEGLSGIGSDVKEFFDLVWSDVDPQQTRELVAWESQFDLRGADSLTEQERRDRLEVAWQSSGGQAPRYLWDLFQDNGFDVYIHEWWVPGTEPAVGVKACVTPRDPVTILVSPKYVLVNKVPIGEPDLLVLAGEAVAQAGEADAVAGNYTDFTDEFIEYEIPTDPEEWPYFVYIGGEVFGTLADVPAARREEFERLCLKVFPAQLWIGVLVNYT